MPEQADFIPIAINPEDDNKDFICNGVIHGRLEGYVATASIKAIYS
jgi:hypothetical protein